MSILITKNGKGAIKLNKTPFGLEGNLQQYIHDNPESIPLYDIKEDIQLLVLAREFNTSSGPIDAIGIDSDGEIYLIETKLYKNPDKRTVVAQVLDYGASIWKSHPDLDSFLLSINNSVQRDFHQTVRERIQSFFSLDDTEVETLITTIGENLNEGNLKFVVLMDSINDQLKDLILYINQNSKFDIYGVELEYYKHDEFEITIPKLFGAEVKKDIATNTTSSVFILDEEFISLYKSIGLEKKITEMISLQKSIQDGEKNIECLYADRTPRNINFFYKSPDRSKMSLVMSIGYNKEELDKELDFWLYEKEIEDKVIKVMRETLDITGRPLAPPKKYGVVGKWPLKKFSSDKLLAFFSSLSNK